MITPPETLITGEDRAELRLLEIFLRRRAEKPDEDVTLAYAEVYGEVVFEDSDALGEDK